MFTSIFRFEVNYHGRQYLFYILGAVFFLMSFLATTSDNVSMGAQFPNTNINAPVTVISSLASLSILALFGAVAFVASGVVRDFDLQTAEFFLTTNVSKFDYLYGRFFGALLFSYGIYFAGLLGVLAGEFAPWIDQERLGELNLGAYWFASWAIVLPNLFFMSCIFFCLATITRSMMMTYVAAVALLMLTFVMGSFDEPETIDLVAKFEPFGLTAFSEQIRYWTVFERNALTPSIEDNFLINRTLWMSIGIAFLVATYFVFPFSVEKASLNKKGKKAVDSDEAMSLQAPKRLPTVQQSFGFKTGLSQLASQTRMEIRNTLKSAPFIVLMMLGVLNILGAAFGSLENAFGTPVYPTTAVMVLLINGTLAFSLLGVLVYYSGEIMLKEKSAKFSEIIDSLPYPNWVMMAAKLTGLITVVVMMLLVSILAAVLFQIQSGYYEFDLLVYLQGLLMFYQFPLYFMCVASVFFYVITRSRYMTMFLVVLYAVALIAVPNMGYEHFLYRLDKPGVSYSVFTDFTHLIEPYYWYTLYWSLWGLLLLVAIHLLWPRGSEFTWVSVRAVARQRFTPGVRLVSAAVSVALLATGGYIFYNTNILNNYQGNLALEAKQAEYEKTYSQHKYRPLPATTSTYAEVEIYPEERDVLLKGHYEMTNTHETAIDEIHFTLAQPVELKRLEMPGGELVSSDAEFNYHIFKLTDPLEPGEHMTVTFETAWLTPGFMNNGADNSLTSNGTFFNNQDLFPLVGYQSGGELQDKAKRRKHGLEPIQRMRKIDDTEALNVTALGGTGRTAFETIVSTSVGQRAIAPGYLQREWTEGDRAYFHYKMDEPIWGFYSFLSGDYALKKEDWNGISIEVYYKHGYNVDRMIYATKRSLEYFQNNFTPYQYRQFRIIEFPRYQGRFAQSFPNTIPFSESIGFTADLRDKKHIDYVFYVTAHELAHQWWAHQVLGADVQGQTMLSETFSQYFALMVMEKEYGEETMKKFLEFELDRYLTDRGAELIEELPVYLVENQPYIHYRKGSVVMYALKDYIGEDAVNGALRTLLNDSGFAGPPYPTTRDFIEILKTNAGPQYENLITDMLEKIVLFDLKVGDVAISETETGQYDISFDVSIAKFEADGEGMETEVEPAGLFDIALLGEKDEETDTRAVIHMEKQRIDTATRRITLTTDVKPHSVGIDPFNKLIDRNPDDNIKAIDT